MLTFFNSLFAKTQRATGGTSAPRASATESAPESSRCHEEEVSCPLARKATTVSQDRSPKKSRKAIVSLLVQKKLTRGKTRISSSPLCTYCTVPPNLPISSLRLPKHFRTKTLSFKKKSMKKQVDSEEVPVYIQISRRERGKAHVVYTAFV